MESSSYFQEQRKQWDNDQISRLSNLKRFWKNSQATAIRQKANAIVTKQMDMFFDEITYAYPELHQ